MTHPGCCAEEDTVPIGNEFTTCADDDTVPTGNCVELLTVPPGKNVLTCVEDVTVSAGSRSFTWVDDDTIFAGRFAATCADDDTVPPTVFNVIFALGESVDTSIPVDPVMNIPEVIVNVLFPSVPSVLTEGCPVTD